MVYQPLLIYHKIQPTYNEDLRIKKKVSDNFNNLMGSFDGTILCKLIGAYCYTISMILLTPCNYGLYWNNRLIIVDNCTPRKGDMIRKKLHCLFNSFEFK